ncbi:hypothetical protein T06_15245, partial [Trichinella sp. T6]
LHVNFLSRSAAAFVRFASGGSSSDESSEAIKRSSWSR